MSFSGEVKEELARQISTGRHCQLAELAALIHFAGRITAGKGKTTLTITTDHAQIARKCYLLIQGAFSCNAQIYQRGSYAVTIEDEENVLRILKAVKLIDVDGLPSRTPDLVDGRLVQKSCCKKAYIRGAFLASGSVSDPQKSYHFEIVCGTREQAMQLCTLMQEFMPDAKVVPRK